VYNNNADGKNNATRFVVGFLSHACILPPPRRRQAATLSLACVPRSGEKFMLFLLGLKRIKAATNFSKTRSKFSSEPGLLHDPAGFLMETARETADFDSLGRLICVLHWLASEKRGCSSAVEFGNSFN